MASSLRKSEPEFSPASSHFPEGLAVTPPSSPERKTEAEARAVAGKAYRALHIGYVALPVIAGVDKFGGVLTDWSQYLAPGIPGLFSLSGPVFLAVLGVVEIGLGIGIALRPRLFADLFALYLTAIIVNFVVYGTYLDVALFNFALAAGACALARLSAVQERARRGYRARPAGGPRVLKLARKQK